MRLRWAYYLLVLTCVAAILFGISWSWADYQSARANYIVASWQRGDKVTETDWQRAHNHISSALFFRPGNAAYLEDMAELHHWRSAQKGITAAELDQNLEQSLRFYRSAITERPLWPYAWGNLALIKAQLRLWDGEFETALQRAQELGPWEPGVQLAVHEAGLISWRQLNMSARQLVLNNFKNSFRAGHQQVRVMLDLTAKYQYLPAFCYYAKRQDTEKNVQALISRNCP